MSAPNDETRIVSELASRVFPHAYTCAISRMREGVSTTVYRLRCDDETFYLRILPEVGASFAPEALAHTLLRAQGGAVPDILYLDDCDPRLGRSVMITTEIAGEPIWRRPFDDDSRQVLRAAGRDLARINSVPVEGFGWITRDMASAPDYLAAEHATSRAFALEHLEDDLRTLRAFGLTTPEEATIRRALIRYAAWLDAPSGWLAHGDLDVTHIFHQNGRYTGIIDFGEIRGADWFYDLGHFRAHDGETLYALALPDLLAGYDEEHPLPADIVERLSFQSVLILLRTLGRFLTRPTISPSQAARHWGWQALQRELA